jgi:hypothetical protein
MTTTAIQWRDAKADPPPTDKLVRVIYTDGVECNAERASGRIYYPENSNMYRYVDVAKWREIETESGATR